MNSPRKKLLTLACLILSPRPRWCSSPRSEMAEKKMIHVHKKICFWMVLCLLGSEATAAKPKLNANKGWGRRYYKTCIK